MAQRIEGLEGLRGYLALWVWVTHVTTMASLSFDKHHGWGLLLANGDTAVGTFIIISGFVIAMNIDQSPTPYREYIVRRAFRLFPAYLVCLLISILILDYSIKVLNDIPWPSPRTADRLRYLTDSQQYFWPHAVLHALLLHGLVPNEILPSSSWAFMGQAWSLTLEWQFYLVAPLLFYLGSRLRLKFIQVAITMALLILMSQYLREASFLPRNLYLFFLGYMTYRIYTNKVPNPETSNKSGMLMIGMLACMCLIRWRSGLGGPLWATIFLTLFFSSGRAQRTLKWLLTNKFSAWLGALSYSFYCVHMIVLFLTSGILIYVFDVKSHPVFATALIATTLPAGLGMAWLIHTTIENPMIAYGRKLASRLTQDRLIKIELASHKNEI